MDRSLVRLKFSRKDVWDRELFAWYVLVSAFSKNCHKEVTETVRVWTLMLVEREASFKLLGEALEFGSPNRW